MFFSETIKKWSENKIYAKKAKARSACRKDAFLFFVLGTVATVVLSGLFAMMIYGDILIYKHGGEFLSTVNTVVIICNISMYLIVVYGAMLFGMYAVRNLYIFLKCLLMKVEAYDLENEPSFRI